jgi:hypothetical protein
MTTGTTCFAGSWLNEEVNLLGPQDRALEDNVRSRLSIDDDVYITA